MFVVKLVRFKNFRSYGNQFTEINLTRSNSTVITAPNGSGKSTILMAIEFALFGRVSNGINKNDLVNTINNKDCLVEVECETNGKQILVRRGIKPAVFEIHVNGKLLDQDAATRDYQERFEEDILGFNINSFRQVVSVSGGSYTPFLLLSAGNRRKIVEELLNLTVFSRMYQLHLAGVNSNKEAIAQTESEIERLKASLKSLKKGLENLTAQEEGYRKTVEENIHQTEERISKIEELITGYQSERAGLSHVVDTAAKKSAKQEKLKQYGRDVQKKLKKLEESTRFFVENDTCPTCTQSITEGFKETILKVRNEKKTQLVESLEKMQSVFEETKAELAELQESLSRISELEKLIHAEEVKEKELARHIKQQERLLTQKSENGEELRYEIRKTDENLTDCEERRLKLLEEKQYNDVVSAIIKDNGIKSKIIAQYVPHMNREINRYLEILNLGLSFEIDQNFNERILSRFKDELSYSSFSAGERARIDIAILFTWRELAKMKNSLSCNLLFLDEIFDAVLDDEGLDSFINLLKNHLKNTNVFLISHRPEVVDKFESNLRIAKTGNFSHIE